jgi:UDP-N-acetylenolpyruvoylglucosamine reductase
VAAGLKHVISGHFGGSNTQSQFTISVNQLKNLIQRKNIIGSPVTVIGSGNQQMFVRTVNTNTVIGTVRQADGGGTTTWIKIFTDRAGNLITTFPVPAPVVP